LKRNFTITGKQGQSTSFDGFFRQRYLAMLLSNWNKTVCFHELAKILHRTDNANT